MAPPERELNQHARPSHSSLDIIYQVSITPGGVVKIEDKAIEKLKSSKPKQNTDGASNSDDTATLPKKRWSSPQSLHSSKKSADQDFNITNCPDSGSEDEEEEGCKDLDEERLTNRKFQEESIPIKSNYCVLNIFKNLEKEQLLSIDVKEGKLLQGEPTVGAEIRSDIVHEQVGGTVEQCVFEWQDSFETFTGRKEVYSKEPGPTIPSTCPYELFTSVWDNDVIDMIVKETNKYAWQTIAPLTERDEGISHGSRLLRWKETDRNEIYLFFSILINMSLCYRARLKEYWTNGTLEMSGLKSLMSRDRFSILFKFIHFIDNNISNHTKSSYEKKILKITPILEHCNKKFQELYVPRQYLSLDESLHLWNGRLSWDQCVSSKTARVGIKSFDLCESDTGYLLKCMLYAGKNSSGVGDVCGFEDTTAKIVLKLSEGYLDIGHVLVMDSYYNQLSLTRYLKTRRTDVVGTQDRRRKGVPHCISSLVEGHMLQGQMVAKHCGDISVIAWQDVKLVTMVSTYHTNEVYRWQRAGQAISKPVVVLDYNQYMGGVDLKDQRLSMYPMERNGGTKWYMKVFRRLLNSSLLNSFIMYQENHTARGEGKKLTHQQFRLAVADLLARRHKPQLLGPNEDLHVAHRLDQGQHTMVKTSRPGLNKRRRCARCSVYGRRRVVSTMCMRCNVGLCIGQCFEQYHRLEDLR